MTIQRALADALGRRLPRRELLASAFAAATLLFAPLAHAQEVVRFASVGGLTDAGLYLADELGFFAEAGITLEMQRMTSAPTLITAIATDQLEVAGISTTPGMFTAAQQGIGLRIVGDKNSARPGFAASRLVIAKALEAATPAEMVQGLRGKVVGVPSRAGSAFFNVAALLKEHGVGLDEVEIKELSYANMVAAISTGSIDAAYMIEPFLSQMIHDGTAVDVSNVGDFTDAGAARINVPLVYSEKFAQNRELAQAFMTAYMRGVRVYNDAFVKGIDLDKVIDIMARHSETDPEVIRSSFPAGLDPNQEINLDTINEMQEFFVEQGFLDAVVPLDTLVDTSFAEAAVAELGRYE